MPGRVGSWETFVIPLHGGNATQALGVAHRSNPSAGILSSLSTRFLTWQYFIGAWAAYQIAGIIWQFWWKAPSGVRIFAFPTPFGRCLTALQMTLWADELIQDAYDKADGKPFALPTLYRWVVFVTDRDRLRSLDNEPTTLISTEEALHDLAFTKPIMGHLQVPPETGKATTSEAHRLHSLALKSRLRAVMPTISEDLRTRVNGAIEQEMRAPSAKNEQSEWRRVQLMPALLRVFTRVNMLVFVGEDLADSPDVYREITDFFSTCVKAFPFLSVLPTPLSPILGPVFMGFGVTRQRIYHQMLQKANRLLPYRDLDYAKASKNTDVIAWTVELSRLRDAAYMAKISLGLLFASAFQIPVVALFCIYNLCMHPESQAKLLAEARANEGVPFSSRNEEMPYMDSFMKETARLGPGVLFSAPRKVIQQYVSPYGYSVPAGNWLAIPQRSLMKDEKLWDDASSFRPFRFVDEETKSSTSRFTHPSHAFPFWGSIRGSCPARFYVSIVMKMILAKLLTNYEIKLEDPAARLYYNFGLARLPNPFLTVLVRERKRED